MQRALPTLYSFRRCPYAMRARLALAVSGQPCIHREVDLQQRPPQLHAASAKATVPVLVLDDGKVLDESLDIMRWTLANRDPEGWLALSTEQLTEAEVLISQCDGEFKRRLDLYKYASHQTDAAPQQHRDEASEFLMALDRLLKKTDHLMGPEPSLVDMALAPFVRQFALVDRTWFDSETWVRLRSWLDRFQSSTRFAGIMAKHEFWHPDAAPLIVDWS